jgi:hypothetical protein
MVTNSERYCAECNDAECRFCLVHPLSFKCRYAQFRYAEYRYAECRGAHQMVGYYLSSNWH